MSRKKSVEDVAAQIADDLEPDWGSISDSAEYLPGLQLLHEISRSFRTETARPAPEPILFEWRHLEVRESIGEGAFGTVYRAHDPVLRREVALKLAHERPDRSPDSDWVIAEARSMARTRHPNILAVHGADVADGRVGIWSDLLHGRTLASVLEDSPRLSEHEVLALAVPLTEALGLIHRRGLVHGDIKPANIMIQRDGTPVLMDFGAAREQGGRGGVAIGSPRFMAPEQFAGLPPTPASDIFAFGVVLARALSGRYPWEADSLEALEQAFERGQRAALDAVPWRFRSLLGELLAADPRQRPDAEQLRERLERLRTAGQRLLRRTAVGVVIASLAIGLVMAVSAYQTEQAAREHIQNYRDMLVASLQEAEPERTSGPTSVKVIYEAIGARMEETLANDPGGLAEMRMLVGGGIGELGEPEAGLEILERALADLDPDDPRMARRRSEAWLEIAELRTDLDDFEGAEEAVRGALEETARRTDELGPQQQLVARNRLVGLLNNQGRPQELLKEQLALLADRKALHGKDSLQTAVDHHNLAVAYQKLGRFEEGLVHERRARELLLANGDNQSLRVGFVTIQIASLQIDLGDYAAAQESVDEAAVLFETNLPPDHPRLLQIKTEQGRLWRLSGREDDAVALFEKILALDSQETAGSRRLAGHNLAFLLLARESWSDAQALLEELLDADAPRRTEVQLYLEAAERYAAARLDLGQRGQAETALGEAIAEQEARGLTGIERYAMLKSWQAALAGHN
ncbi:MAG: serine/threonine-protein kinase [Pseudomonadota bacterium]